MMAASARLRRGEAHSPPALQILLLLVIYLVSASTALASEVYVEDTDRFPGWRGELPQLEKVDPNSVGYGEAGVVRTTLRP